MRLLETYANNCSVDINHKPQIVEKFFPLGGVDKYITIQTKSGMPAKDYSYFQEVISLITPILEKENIKILHLGQDSPPLNGVLNLNNQTSIAQAAYLLRRSQLHAGCDSWMAHFCGAEDVPLVSLYGNTTVANHSPYFYNKDKTIFLESHRNGNKATFAREENPKTVDFINPEDIAAAICKLLNLPFVCDFKTLIIGNQYTSKSVETLPNHVVNPQNLGVPFLVIRGDLAFNEQNIYHQVSLIKSVIFTDRPLKAQVLQQLRPNIQDLVYVLKKETPPDPNFYKVLHQLKIPFKLISWESEETINEWKLDALDCPTPIFRQQVVAPQNLDPNNAGKYFFKTNKILLSNGLIYNSYWSFLNNSPQKDFSPVFVQLKNENLNNLWVESHLCYFVEKIS